LRRLEAITTNKLQCDPRLNAVAASELVMCDFESVSEKRSRIGNHSGTELFDEVTVVADPNRSDGFSLF